MGVQEAIAFWKLCFKTNEGGPVFMEATKEDSFFLHLHHFFGHLRKV